MSYGTGYKAPNLGQLYSAYGGNAQLDPEQSKQWEGGIEGLTGPLDWRLSAYRNDIDDMIAWDTGREAYYNISKARIKRVEWTGSFTTGVLAHQVTLEYLDPRDAKTNEILARRAKQQVKYQLDWLVVNIDWSLHYRYLGQRWDTNYNSNQRVRLGGVSLWDIPVSYPLTTRLTVRGRFANVFDKIMRQLVATRLQDGNSISPGLMLSDASTAKRPTILVFDSGVGGLSIYDEVRQTLPDAHYLYVFDNEAFPYGEKPKQFIVDRVVAIVGAMWRLHRLDMVIVACNTASTISLPTLRERFSCPIIGVVPAIKPAARLTRNGIVGLLATRATVQRSYTHDLITQFAGDCQILQLGTAELVDMAEAKLHGEMVPLPVLRKLLRPWLRAVEPPETVVLGCTHFPLLSPELQSVLPEGTRLVDSGSAIARRAAWLVEHDIDVNGLQGEAGPNRAYCLATTPQVVALMPALTRYGFGLLGKLTL